MRWRGGAQQCKFKISMIGFRAKYLEYARRPHHQERRK